MLDKGAAVQDTIRIVQKLEVGDSLELLSWKGDRSLLLQVMGDEELLIREQGFVVDEFSVPLRKLKKNLKTLIKREFPRSHKIRTRITRKP